MVTVPQGIPTTAAWQLIDQKSVILTSPPAHGGLATVTAEQLDTGRMWLVDRAVCSCTSPGATSLRLYDTSVGPAGLLSGTPDGNYDEADYPTGLLVVSGGQLVGQWSAADDGAVGTLRLQVRVLQQASS